jgi:hypothetical protein
VITMPLPALAPSALLRPAIVAPAPREVSFGGVQALIDSRTVRVVVQVAGVTKADVPLNPTYRLQRYAHPIAFRTRVRIPSRNVTVRLVTYDSLGHRFSSAVRPVYGLPREAYPRAISSSQDNVLARRIRTLAQSYSGIAAVFVQNLRTGRGAAWNARARYQAASTLKLGIAVEVLRVLRGKPQPGTRVAQLFHDMLVHSDNQAANELEIWLAGSTTAGGARVTATLRALGLADTYMNGGYIVGTFSTVPIPLRVERQPPYFTYGKYTTAWDLARLHRYTHRGAVGQGPLMGLPGYFTAADARYLLYTLAHVRDPGKLDRYVGDEPGVSVLHKAGWIMHARHDSGLVYWSDGAFVAVVMTWNDYGVGPSSDILAGRVAAVALERFSATLQLRLKAPISRIQS